MTPVVMQGFPMTQEIVSGEPTDDVKLQSPDDTEGSAAKPTGKGYWLETPEDDVAKDIDKRWSAQDKPMASRLARWEVNTARRDGNPYVKLVKNQDEDTYRIYTPKGIEDAPPSLNKTDDLCIKVVAHLLTDPPKPECEPASDGDDDRSSAEFSTRVLENESTESGFNIPDHVRIAEDLACAHGSGFVYAYLDPHGGGHRPREIMAPQMATTVDPDGQPVLEAPDPATGIVGTIVGPATLRYVALDGKTITDDPTQAMLEWLPKVCGEDLTGKQVRFLPETASGIRDCDGLLVAAMIQIGRLKAMFPETVGRMPTDQLRQLISYRPQICKTLIPKWAGNGEGTPRSTGNVEKGPPDDALACAITAYHRGDLEYPLAAYVVMVGGKFIAHRQEWKEQVRTRTGKMVDRAMDIPVAQFRQYRDTKAQDPYGRGLCDLLRDGDPLRSFAIGAVTEYLHRVNNPHLFVPVGAGIQAKSLNLPRGTPIPYNPAGGGLPQQEEIAPLPSAFMDFYHEIGAEMDSRSGLEEAAQGVASPSVQSGKHAQQIVEQALIALSGPKQEMESGYLRLCRIILQLIRMGYTVPQRMKVVGADGGYKEKEWQGADTGNTTDVKIMLGTSTMLPQSAKEAIALEKFQAQALSLEDYQRSQEGNVRTLIGAQDNPAKQRIKGQIYEWGDGPPDGWQPPQPPTDPTTGQLAVDPATGQPSVPPDPANPFADRRAVDAEQPVALIRHAELARAQSGNKYATLKQKAPVWAGYLDAEYLSTKQAAGVMTVAEQQQMAQQQAQAPIQQQQEAEKQKAHQTQEQERQKGEQSRQIQVEDSDKAHARSLEVEDRKHQNTLAVEQEKHRMASEAKQAERDTVPVSPVETAAPSPQPYTPILPPDLQQLHEGFDRLSTTIEQLATREIPAPVVHVEAPVVNVAAPQVHVEAPVVNVPEQPAPKVTIQAPPKRKRRGTIKGPDGKVYEVESREVTDV